MEPFNFAQLSKEALDLWHRRRYQEALRLLDARLTRIPDDTDTLLLTSCNDSSLSDYFSWFFPQEQYHVPNTIPTC